MSQRIIDEIVQWHKETFPDVKKSGQTKKLEEELTEWYKSFDKLELADVLICSAVLWQRFNCQIGHAIYVYGQKIANELLEYPSDLMSKKMVINKKRNWQKIDGVYRHVESREK